MDDRLGGALQKAEQSGGGVLSASLPGSPRVPKSHACRDASKVIPDPAPTNTCQGWRCVPGTNSPGGMTTTF